MSKPKGEGWKRLPSVMTGGKAYFYVRFTPHAKQTVVWDRIDQKWVCRIEWYRVVD